MFAPPALKPQTKPTANPGRTLAPARAMDLARPSGGAAERARGFEWRIGNQAALRRLVQAKLAVGPTDDPLEHEADRIADQVMRMPDPADRPPVVGSASRAGLQRACASCEEEMPRTDAVARGIPDEPDQDVPVDANQPLVTKGPDPEQPEPLTPAVCEWCEGIRRKRSSTPDTGLGAVSGRLAGTKGAPAGGRPIEAGARSFFEQRFGHSFEHVRVHTDAHAAQSARAVNALAYTAGHAIVFAPGQYAPETQTGRRLLAHELAHVLQQNPSPAAPGPPALTSGPAQSRTGATGVIQRWSADGPADRAINTIVCDGSGGIRVQMSTGNDPAGTACVGDCVRKHEGSHRADALATNATVCKEKADGSQVNCTVEEQKPTEIKASQVEIDCLNAKLPAAGTDCRPAIQARIRTMTAYRDSFR